MMCTISIMQRKLCVVTVEEATWQFWRRIMSLRCEGSIKKNINTLIKFCSSLKMILMCVSCTLFTAI